MWFCEVVQPERVEGLLCQHPVDHVRLLTSQQVNGDESITDGLNPPHPFAVVRTSVFDPVRIHPSRVETPPQETYRFTFVRMPVLVRAADTGRVWIAVDGDDMTRAVALEAEAKPDALGPARPRMNRGFILLAGVIVIPAALALVFNSWGPLTESSAFRMAASTVAGQTIAILSAVVVLILTVKRGYGPASVIAFTVIVVVVATAALSNIASAGDILISRLDLVRETYLLNQ